jgi:hypothetical protein
VSIDSSTNVIKEECSAEILEAQGREVQCARACVRVCVFHVMISGLFSRQVVACSSRIDVSAV